MPGPGSGIEEHVLKRLAQLRDALKLQIQQLTCEHEWTLYIYGEFDEEFVRCRKCGRDRWPSAEMVL